jgi:Zn2+/Cd2+-exporting ATPase
MEAKSYISDVKYRIEGMDCADCALTLERGIAKLEGVERVSVNFSTGLMEASGDFDSQQVVKRVEALGYQVADPLKTAGKQASADPASDGVIGFLRYLLSKRETAIALTGALLLLLSAPLAFLPVSPLVDSIRLGLQLGVVLLAGFPIVRKGLRSLVYARKMTIDLLMSIATLGAVLIGELGEAATVILLFAIGEALEGYTAQRARNSLTTLLALKPDEASVLRPCMDCAEHLGADGYESGPCVICGEHETRVPVEQVAVGEMVIVRPGERIPVDGVIHTGISAINQASVTGESVPTVKSPGEEVFAGTLNGEAALEVRVNRPPEDSTISRIVRLVEQAQSQRAPVERFIDRFAAWYTPAVVILAALLAAIPPLFFGAPFYDTPDGTRGWLYRSLALLIVACPCALVISTPVTMVSALSGLARRGILVKGGAFLDALARIRAIAFDKTGTLTQGKPRVVAVRAAACPSDDGRCPACDEMIELAAAVEARSEHPIAQAILDEAAYRGLGLHMNAAHDVQALAGQGVQGRVNGSLVTVGSHTLFHERYDECEQLHPYVQAAEALGHGVMLVSRDEQVLGFVSVADLPRQTSQAALQSIKAHNPDIHLVMLTGDNPAVAQKIADQVGAVDEVRAGLMPEDKLGAVHGLLAQYGLTAMVGDGVNDAPALAASSVGIAMGGAGSAQAMETADVVLMQDDLAHLPDTLRTSQRAHRIILQNIAFSLAVKAAFLLLTLPGLATLWMAVFADMGASLLVTLNGMRMLRE